MILLVVLFVSLFLTPALANAVSDDPPYLKPLIPSVTVTPLLTTGESVPRTSNPSQSFRMVGVPDGMGLFRGSDGRVRLLVNHELAKSDASQPVPGAPLQKGSFVSEFVLSVSSLSVVSGDYAATTLLDSKTGRPLAGSMAWLCSAFLAGPHTGFDRFVYLTGEEALAEDSLDGKGGMGFAFVEGVAWTLPEQGRYRKENMVVLPGLGLKTVIVGLEDGPKGLKSQLYLYVGEKILSSNRALERNGLVGGRLFVLTTESTDRWDEKHFSKLDRPLAVRWKEIPGAGAMTDEALDTASVAAGSFNFNRIEDGAYDRNRAGVFYFVTTGGGIAANRNGRLYRLTLDPADPAGRAGLLEILLDGDEGDPIRSPDNVDANAAGDLVIQEDFTFAVNLSTGRNPSIWLYKIDSGKLIRLAEVTSRNRESSGVIDASDFFGPGSWLVNVQAHDLTSREVSGAQGIVGDGYLVEGGQILLLKTGN